MTIGKIQGEFRNPFPLSEILAHQPQRILFQTAYLGLGNLDLIGNFHLRLPLKEPQFDNIPLPFSQMLHRRF